MKKEINFLDSNVSDIIEAFKERLQRVDGTWVDTNEDIKRQKNLENI